MKSGALKKIGIILIVIVLLSAAGLVYLYKSAGKIVKNYLEESLGKGFSVKSIDIKWNYVEAEGIEFKEESGLKLMSLENLKIYPSFMSFFSDKIIVDSIEVSKFYSFVEIKKDGSIKHPFIFFAGLNKKEPEMNGKENKKDKKKIYIGKVILSESNIDFVDRKNASIPVKITLTKINGEYKPFIVPSEGKLSDFKLNCEIKQKNGKINIEGKIDPEILDFDGKLNIYDLNLIPLRPYYEEKGDLVLKTGLLSLNSNIKVKEKKINAPTAVVLKHITFEEKESFFAGIKGATKKAVVSMMENKKGEVTVHFNVVGDLNNPKFKLKDSIKEKFTAKLSESIGLPVTAIGKGIVEGTGKTVQGIGEGVKGLGKSFKEIFSK